VHELTSLTSLDERLNRQTAVNWVANSQDDSQEDSQAHGRLRTMAHNYGMPTGKIEPGRTVMDICGR